MVLHPRHNESKECVAKHDRSVWVRHVEPLQGRVIGHARLVDMSTAVPRARTVMFGGFSRYPLLVGIFKEMLDLQP